MSNPSPSPARRKNWWWIVPAVGLLWPAHPALSHPLGEQSVDHYSQMQITPHKVVVSYDVDLAEVATFQEMRRLDANGDGVVDDAEKHMYAEAQAREKASGLHLEINGRVLPLAPVSAKVFLLPGPGALPTMRIIATLETSPGALAAALRGTGSQSGVYQDGNDPNRLGWRQIGIRGLGTTVSGLMTDGQPATVSPQGFTMDRSGDQVDVRRVEFRFLPAAASEAGRPAPATSTSVAPRRHDSDSFASLMTLEHLTRARMGWLLLLAAGLGGLHALSPGHGKTLVAAYLVGSRGTAWHALALGMIVTCTHTAGVFALGLVTLFASHYLLPETLYPWLTAVSGLVIAQIGLLRLFGRGGLHPHVHGDEHLHEHEHGMVHSHADVHQDRPAHAHVHGGHVHAHAHVETGHSHPSLSQDEHQHHEHEHAHGHHHHHHLPMAGEAITWRSLLALGVSGGLVPCPSALVVLLSAIALHRIGFGLALIVAFSAGLAVVLTAIGIAMVCARDFLSNRFALPPWLLGLVPRVGAALITVIGLAIALPAVLLLARRY